MLNDTPLKEDNINQKWGEIQNLTFNKYAFKMCTYINKKELTSPQSKIWFVQKKLTFVRQKAIVQSLVIHHPIVYENITCTSRFIKLLGA